MLVFMLGVMLPAAALIAVGVWHLRTIQREKSVEAVIQREYQQVLAIAEKRIDARAYEIAEEASAKFPDAHEGDELEAFPASHRDIAHAFLWTGKGHRDRLLEELWGVAIRSTWEPTSDSLACSIPIPGVGSQCGPKVAASQTIAKTRSS